MYFTASILAYDFMDSIQWTATIRSWSGPENSPESEEVLRAVGLFPGEGQSDPREWLRELLVAVLERT